MIHHTSIAAEDPRHVASVLAELMGGRAYPFPMYSGAFVAFAPDEHGTAVEIYPSGTALIPDDGDLPPLVTRPNEGFVAGHVAMSVPLEPEAIRHIAEREGWRVQRRSRGPFFEVMEVWVENRFLFELLTPEMAASYTTRVTMHTWERDVLSAMAPR
jgi:hypothetical protein